MKYCLYPLVINKRINIFNEGVDIKNKMYILYYSIL